MPYPATPIRTTPVVKLNQPDDNYKFRKLPPPSGPYPFRLELKNIVQDLDDSKMVFHIVGDTGSVRNPDFQKIVVSKMVDQFNRAEDAETTPQFLYHLGDIVYNFGEADLYEKQFFEPYSKYPAPILAIAGNHDSDVNVESKTPYESLDPFRQVFCDTECRDIPFSNQNWRKSNVQPNIYWTLESPLATIIGLHSNVPKYGIITPEQREWFIGELRHAAQFKEKALIVCLHHAPYSADINHGSSLPMIEFLENAFAETGIIPDMVFSGHVHNYQRFIKTYSGEKPVTYIVAGAGGYDELHPIAEQGDQHFSDQIPFFENVVLQNYCYQHHGFLKLTIQKDDSGLSISGNYYTIPHNTPEESILPASLFESFQVKVIR